MNYRKYLKSKIRGISENYKKGDVVSFYNDAGDKVSGRILSVNGGTYSIDYNGDTYQTNDIISEAVVFKKGDIVSFHNDLRKMVQGRIVSISGDKYVIDVHGIKFKRSYKDLFVNDRLGEDIYGMSGYGAGIGIGLFGRTGSAMSLTDPPGEDDDNETAASLHGELSDIHKKVLKVKSKLKSGDVEGAAKSAVSGVFRYGDEYKEILDKEIGSNAEFSAAYKKAHDAYQAGK